MDTTTLLAERDRALACVRDLEAILDGSRAAELEATLRAVLAEAHAGPWDATNRKRLVLIHALARRALGGG